MPIILAVRPACCKYIPLGDRRPDEDEHYKKLVKTWPGLVIKPGMLLVDGNFELFTMKCMRPSLMVPHFL